MGYRGRKRRLKNFWENAENIMNSFMGGKTTKPVRRSGRWIRKGTEGRRVVVKGGDHLTKTLLKNDMLKERIKDSEKKPEYFTVIHPKGRVFMKKEWGVQEYFNKPNILQIRLYLELKRNSKTSSRGFTEEEYLMVKQFMNNRVNRGITSEKIDEAYNELRRWTRDARDDALLHPHNVLIQGINRDGKIRLTIIDV